MTSQSQNKKFPMSFRPEPDLEEFIYKEKAIHKEVYPSDTIKRLLREVMELRKKPQTLPNGDGFEKPEPQKDDHIIQRWQKEYDREMARQQAITDARVEREEHLSKIKLEREHFITEEQKKRRTSIWNMSDVEYMEWAKRENKIGKLASIYS